MADLTLVTAPDGRTIAFAEWGVADRRPLFVLHGTPGSRYLRHIGGVYERQRMRMILTSNRVFGLARTDQEWSIKLEAALTASRREHLEHGTNAAYLHGCVCQRVLDVSARQDGQEPELRPFGVPRLRLPG
jgi:hypothetical protein